jgi:hypothetical protein
MTEISESSQRSRMEEGARFKFSDLHIFAVILSRYMYLWYNSISYFYSIIVALRYD